MNSYKEISIKAKSHRENGDYQKAISNYQTLLEHYADQCNKWDFWSYASCLIKTQNYDAALKIARIGYQKDSTFKLIKQVYAWAIYHTAIKTPGEDSVFAKAIKAITKLTDSSDKYAPNTLAILKAGEHWNQKQYWENTIDLLFTVTPDFFLQKSYSYTDKHGDKVEVASPLEKYYALLTKALIAKKEWQQCILVASEALDAITKFHFANNIWFRWRMSEAHYHLGQHDEAIQLLKYIQVRKNDWFIISAIGVNQLAQGNTKEAKLYLAQACLTKGELSRKVKTIRHLIDIFRKETDHHALNVHLGLLKFIYEREAWKLPNEIDLLIAQQSLNNSDNFRKTLGLAQQIWENIVATNLKEYQGVISMVFPNGKAGFIKNKQQSYFASIRDFKAKESLFKQGQKVRFNLKDGYDKKKKIQTKNAFNIQLTRN